MCLDCTPETVSLPPDPGRTSEPLRLSEPEVPPRWAFRPAGPRKGLRPRAPGAPACLSLGEKSPGHLFPQLGPRGNRLGEPTSVKLPREGAQVLAPGRRCISSPWGETPPPPPRKRASPLPPPPPPAPGLRGGLQGGWGGGGGGCGALLHCPAHGLPPQPRSSSFLNSSGQKNLSIHVCARDTHGCIRVGRQGSSPNQTHR